MDQTEKDWKNPRTHVCQTNHKKFFSEII